jgi:hypothetical protein
MLMLVLLAAAPASADVIDGEELVDPTRPLFYNQRSTNSDSAVTAMINRVLPSSFDLSFIRLGGNGAMAVINDQRVGIGDSIGGAEVVAIDRSSVTLSINNQEQRISLYDTDVKSAQGSATAPVQQP